MRAYLLAAVAAIAVQPLVLAMWAAPSYLTSTDRVPLGLIPVIAAAVLMVATAFVTLLGVPIFVLLQRHGRASARNVGLAGLLAGAVPFGLTEWPVRQVAGFGYTTNWHGHTVVMMKEGLPTLYGWLAYLEGLASFGLHGCIGALLFLMVWRRLRAAQGTSWRQMP